MNYLRIKNWEAFQHYKDRNPPWIKLHVALLDDYEFSRLPDVQKGHLMMLWLFASKNEGRIPADPKFLQNKLGLDSKPDLAALVDEGWLQSDDGENASTEKWASRYVSEATRALLLEKANHACQSCGSKDSLEIDHVVPVSQGGTGDTDNLQVLCRPCNRSKRVRSTRYADAEQLATQTPEASVALARSREESQRRKATETEARAAFEAFWSAWPRKVAKSDAEKAWRKVSAADVPAVMAGLARAVTCEQWRKDGGQFIPHAATWLNGRRWEDQDIPTGSGAGNELDVWLVQTGHGGMQ